MEIFITVHNKTEGDATQEAIWNWFHSPDFQIAVLIGYGLTTAPKFLQETNVNAVSMVFIKNCFIMLASSSCHMKQKLLKETTVGVEVAEQPG